jgi:peptidyl-prolyl cis-trans isomerase B (cyclophilin B)
VGKGFKGIPLFRYAWRDAYLDIAHHKKNPAYVVTEAEWLALVEKIGLGSSVVDEQASGALERRDRRSRGWSRAGWAIFLIALMGTVIYHFATKTTSKAGSMPSQPRSATTSQAQSPQAENGGLPPFTPPASRGANCSYPADNMPAAKPVHAPKTGKIPTDPATVSVSMTTNAGNIGLQLDNAKSPCTVNSFVSLAQQGYFNDTPCHRLTTGALSVLQCGDPTGQGTGGPGYQVTDEYPIDQYPAGDPRLSQPVLYPRGTLAMANAGPGTNGSQFFLVYRESQLPPNYTVFGTIDQAGLATLDKIASAGVAGGSHDGAPSTKVDITVVNLG